MASLLAALPNILALILELIRLIKDGQKPDPAKDIAEITQVLRQVREAQSAEDRRAAARNLSRVINRM